MPAPQMYEIANDHTNPNKGVKRVLPKQNYNENNLAELQKVYTLQKEIARVLDQTAATKIQSRFRNRQRFKALRHAAVGQSVQRIPSVISESPRARSRPRSVRSVSPKDRKTIQHSPKKRGLDNASPQSIKRRRKQAPSMEAKKKGDRSRARRALRAKARSAETRIVPAPVSSDARSPHTLQSRQVVASNLRDLLGIGLSPNASMSNVLQKKNQLSLTFAGPTKPPKPTSQSTNPKQAIEAEKNARNSRRAEATNTRLEANAEMAAKASKIISHALQAISYSPNRKKQLNRFYELLGFSSEKGARSNPAFLRASLVLHPNKLQLYAAEDNIDVLKDFYKEMVADPQRKPSERYAYKPVNDIFGATKRDARRAREERQREFANAEARLAEERKKKENFIKGQTNLSKELSDLRNNILSLQEKINDAVERQSHWLAIPGKKLESESHSLAILDFLAKVRGKILQKDFLMNEFVRKFEFNKNAKAAKKIQSVQRHRHAQKTRKLEKELKKLNQKILNGERGLKTSYLTLVQGLKNYVRGKWPKP